MLHLAKNLIADADVATIRKNSFRNFHAKGVDYLCLHRTPELTVKLYCFDPETLVCGGPDDLVVNPHSHGYNFSTYVLQGSVTNIEYAQSLDKMHTAWHETKYRSRLKGAAALTYGGVKWLAISRLSTYWAGEHYEFDHDQIHSIRVSPIMPTVLLLFQHADQPKDHTLLYTQTRKLPEFAGLYTPWTEEAIVTALDAVTKTLRGET